MALVGYTNAGKSSLFNRLSGADALVADKLFATLDPDYSASKSSRCARVYVGRYGWFRKPAAPSTRGGLSCDPGRGVGR